jgi:hypothetical protein
MSVGLQQVCSKSAEAGYNSATNTHRNEVIVAPQATSIDPSRLI